VLQAEPSALSSTSCRIKCGLSPHFRLSTRVGGSSYSDCPPAARLRITCFAILRVRRFQRMAEREKTLTINEIYHSIQGESTWVGQPCVFVRLTFCNLRCNYCDTEYAFYEGKKRTLTEIVNTVAEFRCPLVEITGGEPLLQKNVLPLMSMLCDAGYTVLLETGGAHDISKVDLRVHRIMDLKPPGSCEVETNLWSNIDHLALR